MSTLHTLVQRDHIVASAEWADTNPNMSDMPYGSSHWRVRLTRQANGTPRRQMTIPFSMGPALSREPQADDVLECLLSDASSADQAFEDWARDYGFDTDSRKAERTYKAVTTQTEKLRRFLGDAFEEYLYAER